VVFGLMILSALAELAISAWLTSIFCSDTEGYDLSVCDRSRFTLFASIWTIVFSVIYMGSFLYCTYRNIKDPGIDVASHLIMLSFTWAFWLAAASSTTSTLGFGNLNCELADVFYCSQLSVEAGLAWLLFVLTTFALITVCIIGISATLRGKEFFWAQFISEPGSEIP
ncbi:hypothetical protein JAAARDRAFT_119712, partial [Jaapia argillacea MUCL 33604]